MNENECTGWVWNKGIAFGCDHRIPDEFPKGEYTHLPYSESTVSNRDHSHLVVSVEAGDLIWVRASLIESFVDHILPEIRQPFVMVTGDSDDSIPSQCSDAATRLLNSPKLLHWFTQNYDGTASRKLSPLPIGIDFHTLQLKPFWGMIVSTHAEQSAAIDKIAGLRNTTGDRVRKVYVDAGISGGSRIMPGMSTSMNRDKVRDMITSNPSVYLQPSRLPQVKMWIERSKYQFTLSYPGNGLDCHRTWEALAMGSIVITPHSSLDVLYTGLPVVLIEDLSEITQTNLNKWSLEYESGNWQFEKLRTFYWVDQIRKKSVQCLQQRGSYNS
ncbi:MAG: hypothetical protein AAF353_00090 [Pseudomonadota bacterium]